MCMKYTLHAPLINCETCGWSEVELESAIIMYAFMAHRMSPPGDCTLRIGRGHEAAPAGGEEGGEGGSRREGRRKEGGETQCIYASY